MAATEFLMTDGTGKEIADAVLEGRRPQEAFLIKGFSLKDKADDAVGVIENISKEDAILAIEAAGEDSVTIDRKSVV